MTIEECDQNIRRLCASIYDCEDCMDCDPEEEQAYRTELLEWLRKRDALRQEPWQ